MPVPDRDVEGMLRTAELSFLSLWARAKCSRYFSAVCGEGVLKQTPHIPAERRGPHTAELQVGISLKGTAAHGEPVLEQGLARMEPRPGADSPEGNCSSQGIPWSQFILNGCSPQEGHAGAGEKCEEQGEAKRGCYKLTTCEQRDD